MSYGRRPFYIYGGSFEGGGDYFAFVNGGEVHEGSVVVEYDAMAQFVASCWWRDNRDSPLPSGEMGDLIRRGYELRPELASGAPTGNVGEG